MNSHSVKKNVEISLSLEYISPALEFGDFSYMAIGLPSVCVHDC